MGARWGRPVRHRMVAAAVGIGLLGIPSVMTATPVAAAPSSPAAPATPAAPAETSSTFNGTFQRISVAGDGTQADGDSDFATISQDGRFVTFTSEATNLVPGDTNGVNDLFIRDRVAGTTERLNVSTAGAQANDTMGPYVDSEAVMSADARYVAFNSKASNLVPGDTNGTSDIFVRDRQTGTTVRANTSATGAQGTQLSSGPALSADGRYLSFLTWSQLAPDDTDGWADVYRKDLATGAIVLVSVDRGDGVRALAQTADGSKVAYTETSRLFLRDVAAGTSVEIPLVPGGSADGWVYPTGITPDGSRIVFSSTATNIVAGDVSGTDVFVTEVASGATTRISAPAGGSASTADPSMSADGSTVAFTLFGSGALRVVDLAADHATVVPDDWAAWRSSLTDQGETVVFASSSSTRVPGDTNGFRDIFLANLDPTGDDAGPIVTCAEPDGAWHDANVTVACTSTDLDSSLANPADAAFTLATQEADGTETASATTASRQVCDVVGNCTTAVSTGHRFDRRPPASSVPDEAKGTFVRGAEVAAAFACVDGGSGVASCTATVDGDPIAAGAPLPTGSAVDARIDVTGTDQLGNTAGAEAPFEVVDDALTGSVRRPDGFGTSGATVRLWPDGATEPAASTTTDAFGWFTFDAAAAGPGSFAVEVTRDGYLDAWYGGADRASATPVDLGVRPADIEVALTAVPDDDVTPPVVSCDPPSTSAIFDHNATVDCTATDDTMLADSGDQAFSLATTVADGEESDVAVIPERTVCDTAENCTTVGPFGPYLVDRKAPVVTIGFPAEGQALAAGSTQFPIFDCDDLYLESCTTTAPSGPLPTTGGSHSFSVTGTDATGRTTTVTRTYVVQTTTITGRYYRYPTEQPIAGALVELWSPWDPLSGPASATTTTSANGAWTISGLIPDVPYYVRLSKGGSPAYPTIWHGGAETAQTSQPVWGPANGVSTIYYDWGTPTDSTPPTATCSLSTSPNTWTSLQASASCQISDPSGLAPWTPTAVLLTTSVAAGEESATAATSSVQACDAVGNCTTVGPYTFKIDRKAPVVSCPPVNTAWTGAERSYACTTTDGGVGGQIPSFGLFTNVGAGNWSANASTTTVGVCDALGNCVSAQLTGNRIDRAAPISSCAPPPAAWSAANQSVPCTLSDPGSGLFGPTTAYATTSVGAGQETATANASTPTFCDMAGNCTVRTVSGFKIDRKGPTVSCASPDGLWHAGNVSLSCTHSDGGAGLPATYDPFPPIFVNIPYPINFSATTNVAAGSESASAAASASSKCDVVNNCTSVSISGNKVDRRGPTTASCPAPPATWSATEVTVTCTAADGGSGLATSSYSPSTSIGSGAESASATMGSVSVCDLMGNCSSLTAAGAWKVDRRAPIATCATAPTAGSVLDDNVSVACTVSESGSGRSATTPASFALATAVPDGAEALTSTDSRQVCDVVSNCATVAARGPYGIDRKAPSVSVAAPAPDAYFQVGAVPTADFACEDLFAATCEGSVADGEPLPSSLGSHDFTVTGTDQVGRSTTVTRSYTVLPADGAAPKIRCAPAPSVSSWRSTNVSIACTATDASPLADPDLAAFDLVTTVADGDETASAAVAPVEVCDVLGQCATTTPYGPFKVDRKDPSVSCAAPPTGWVKVNVSLPCTPSDGGSGPGAAFNLVTSVVTGQWDGDASTNLKTTCDKAGNCIDVQRHHLRVDRAGPVITCGPAPEGWSKVNRSVSCTVSDPGSGRVGPATITATTKISNGSEVASATALATACDVLGNCTNQPVTGFKIDRKVPAVVCDAADTAWHPDNVTLACVQSDAGSGLAPSSPEGGAPAFEVATTVAPGAYSTSARALASSDVCDLAGNCRTVAIAGNRVDRSPPKVTATAPKDGAVIALGATVTVDYACSDRGSGLTGCSAELPDGATFVASDLGPQSLTVEALDRAGNRTTTTVSWEVVAPVSGRIVDLAGVGIEGATVFRYPAAGPAEPIDAVVTAADGSFHFDDVAPGSYKFGAAKPGAYLSRYYTASTFSLAKTWVLDGAAPKALGQLALTPAAVLGGRVVSTTGEGIAGVEVAVFNSGVAGAPPIATVTTGEDGTWRLEGLVAGNYRYQLTAPGYASEWHVDAATKAASTIVPLATSQQVTDLQDDLAPSG